MTANESSQRALILCGGGARGAMEVGFYRAIVELGLSFDVVIGSSVGALNGAFIAAGVPPADLADLWRRSRKRDVIGFDWRILRGGASGFITFRPLRRRLEEALPVKRFEQLRHPLVIATTNLQTGQASYHQGEGDLMEPLIASMSLPGLFAPVWIAGQQHVDGSVTDNVPVGHAHRRGIREVLVMLCTCCPPDPSPLLSPLKILSRSFMLALDAKYLSEIGHLEREGTSVRVVRPSFGRNIGWLDFDYSDALIEAGYEQSLAQLQTVGASEVDSTIRCTS